MGLWYKSCGKFWGREWNLQDVVTASVLVIMHCLCLFAPFHFTWGALWVSYILYLVTALGITLSYHRNLAHKSFKLPKWLEYLFAYFGVLSLQVYTNLTLCIYVKVRTFNYLSISNEIFYFLFFYMKKKNVCILQGSPIAWVSTHRYHHQFTDTEKDAHSPLKGFWFSHIGWILDSNSRFGKVKIICTQLSSSFYIMINFCIQRVYI